MNSNDRYTQPEAPKSTEEARRYYRLPLGGDSWEPVTVHPESPVGLQLAVTHALPDEVFIAASGERFGWVRADDPWEPS